MVRMLSNMVVTERLPAGQMDLLVMVMTGALGEEYWQRKEVKWREGTISIWLPSWVLKGLSDSLLPM